MNVFLAAALGCSSSCSTICSKKEDIAYTSLEQTLAGRECLTQHQKFNAFIQTEGEYMLEWYKKSAMYPFGCLDMARITEPVLERRYGIRTRVVEGYHVGSYSNKEKKYIHAFNILTLDGEEYILDFTKNQFTKPIRVLPDYSAYIIDENKGVESGIYLKKRKEAKEYLVENEYIYKSPPRESALTILHNLVLFGEPLDDFINSSE